MLKTLFAFEDDAPRSARPKISTLDFPEIVDECRARSGIYRLLGGVFVEEPSAEFLAAIRRGDSLGSLAAAGVTFDADFLESDETSLSEALACEYTTLFASSGGFPPFESVRLTGRYKQEPCFQTEQIYRTMGFTLLKGRFEIFPDHLGVELMFVAELLERSAIALESDDLPGYKRLEKEIKRFWTLHLGRWVRGYCRLIERAAQHSFYREMARFLGSFADEEIVAMNLKRLEDLDQGRAVVPKSEIKVEFNPDEPVCGACPAGPSEGAVDKASVRVSTIQPLLDLRV
jgi:TorA maturation chaperone TorD